MPAIRPNLICACIFVTLAGWERYPASVTLNAEPRVSASAGQPVLVRKVSRQPRSSSILRARAQNASSALCARNSIAASILYLAARRHMHLLQPSNDIPRDRCVGNAFDERHQMNNWAPVPGKRAGPLPACRAITSGGAMSSVRGRRTIAEPSC